MNVGWKWVNTKSCWPIRWPLHTDFFIGNVEKRCLVYAKLIFLHFLYVSLNSFTLKIRSSHSQLFYRVTVLKSFVKFSRQVFFRNTFGRLLPIFVNSINSQKNLHPVGYFKNQPYLGFPLEGFHCLITKK